MIIFRLVSYLLGYLFIVIEGEQLEKFVNFAAARGIVLWDIRRISSKKLTCKLRLEGVYPLRHIARKTNARFYITEKKGLPFVFSRLKRRKALVAGAALFIFSLYLLSSFIWTVEVAGNTAVKTADILKAANAAGLSRGALKWKLNVEKVEDKILKEFDAVSWVGVHIKGTYVSIEIVEKKLPPEDLTGPSNIVAGKAGLVKEILVLSGHPVVNEGETVVKGQTLISGEMPPPVQQDTAEVQPAEENTAEPTYVRARGIVRACVWYEGYGEAALVETGCRFSGKSIGRVCIKLGSKEIILKGPRVIPYKKYECQAEVKSIPAWRNLSVPVELSTEKYLELVPFKEVRSIKAAKELAIQRALEDVEKSLPSGAIVLNKRVEDFITRDSENIIRAKVTIEALEEIGLEKPFNP